MYSYSGHCARSEAKSALFFTSPFMPMRFLSTMVVLKIETQVNYPEQAFRSLSVDLKTDEGKALLLGYQCVPILLSHLNAFSKGLLSGALDGLHQMTTESGPLQPFLTACSNESFFILALCCFKTPG
ncbi:coiled-coil domain-containing protein 138-like [Numida meleagris]|uniref:coiled-coil domain-containing protein 138-like n=1 Tax=Numida meleagris TaxID=8996 RepID=UPI000B3DA821|nr:coiled-coil domain-containing protein 138-like [Numida meleagris]